MKQYGYYIYHNSRFEESIPSLKLDGFITAKEAGVTTIIKWCGGETPEKLREQMVWEIVNVLEPCEQDTAMKYAKWAQEIRRLGEQRGDTLVEFGVIRERNGKLVAEAL